MLAPACRRGDMLLKMGSGNLLGLQTHQYGFGIANGEQRALRQNKFNITAVTAIKKKKVTKTE
jgi:hypothetical protein